MCNKVHFNWQNRLRDNPKPPFHQENEPTPPRARQGILHRRQERVSGAFADGRERSFKRGPRHGSNGVTEKLDGSGFAERARFALESHAHGLGIGGAHRQALSCNKGRKTKSEDSPWAVRNSRIESGAAIQIPALGKLEAEMATAISPAFPCAENPPSG